jgi:hypothetical protein
VTPQAAVLWTALVAVIVVLVLSVLALVRAMREIVRIKRRVDAFAELPVVASLAKAGDDAERIAAAVERIEPLVARAKDAVAVIREGPIPADVRNAVVRIGIEVQNLREFVP